MDINMIDLSSDEDVPLRIVTRRNSDEDVPLSIVIKRISDNDSPQSYKELYKYSMERCEKCKFIFHNRYDLLIHNADHIIVPLNKLNIVKCNLCDRHLLSQVDLHNHKLSKHHMNPDILTSLVIKQPIIKCVDNVSHLLNPKSEKIAKTAENFEENLEEEDLVKNVNVEHKTEEKDTLVRNENADDSADVENIMRSIIKQQPVVKCDDTCVTMLIKAKIEKDIVKIKKKKLKKKLKKLNKNGIVENGHVKNENEDDVIEKDIAKIRKTKLKIKLKDLCKNGIVENNHVKKEDEDAVIEKEIDKIRKKNLKKELKDLCKNGIVENGHVKKENEDTLFEDNATINISDSDSEMCDKSQQVAISNSGVKNIQNGDVENKIKYRSRLMFEDDNYESDIMNLNCIEETHIKNVNNINPGDESDEYDIIRIDDTRIDDRKPSGVIVLGSKTEKPVEEITFSPSIHYDDLISPGLYKCRRCCKIFPNRYKLIRHEVTHIRFARRRAMELCLLCDRYIPGNYHSLRRHMKAQHPTADTTRNYRKENCKLCGFIYQNFHRHYKRYHQVIYRCSTCAKKFESETEYEEHNVKCTEQLAKFIADRNSAKETIVKEPTGPVVIKICDVCLMFTKYNHSVKYKCVGELCVMGEKQTCSICLKEYFSVNVVKRVVLRQEVKKQPRHKLSKEVRLKNIQRRLKNMKIMTRY